MSKDDTRPGIFYGWWIVLAAACTLMIAGGVGVYSFPVFLKPLEEEFGWSRAALSGPIGLATLSAGFWLPLIGRLLDRYGPRRIMVPAALLMAACNFLLGRMTELWQLYVLFLMIAPAMVSLTSVPAQTLVSHWFVSKRGLAMGLTMMGTGIGGALMPKLSHALIVEVGWRTAYLVLASMLLLLVTPVVGLVLRHKPADLGLRPDGESAGSGEESRRPPHLTGLPVSKAIRTPAFWLLATIFFVISLGGSYIVLHLVAFATDVGISAGAAASALSLLAGTSILGRLGFGVLGDRLSKRGVMAFCFLVHAVALVLLLQVETTGMLYLFAVVYGFGMGGNIVVIPLIVGECFGLVSFAAIRGLLGAFFTLGAAIGPVMAGRIFDVAGSYSLAFIIALLAYVAATVAVWFVSPPHRTAEPAAGPWPEGAAPVRTATGP